MTPALEVWRAVAGAEPTHPLPPELVGGLVLLARRVVAASTLAEAQHALGVAEVPKRQQVAAQRKQWAEQVQAHMLQTCCTKAKAIQHVADLAGEKVSRVKGAAYDYLVKPVQAQTDYSLDAALRGWRLPI
jgi:hypothetical protein